MHLVFGIDWNATNVYLTKYIPPFESTQEPPTKHQAQIFSQKNINIQIEATVGYVWHAATSSDTLMKKVKLNFSENFTVIWFNHF